MGPPCGTRFFQKGGHQFPRLWPRNFFKDGYGHPPLDLDKVNTQMELTPGQIAIPAHPGLIYHRGPRINSGPLWARADGGDILYEG